MNKRIFLKPFDGRGFLMVEVTSEGFFLATGDGCDAEVELTRDEACHLYEALGRELN